MDENKLFEQFEAAAEAAEQVFPAPEAPAEPTSTGMPRFTPSVIINSRSRLAAFRFIRSCPDPGS